MSKSCPPWDAGDGSVEGAAADGLVPKVAPQERGNVCAGARPPPRAPVQPRPPSVALASGCSIEPW